MISMTDYKLIIQLRNKGKSQDEIAKAIGISRRTVIRYLKDGHIPQYSREKPSNRADPMVGFYQMVKEKLELNHKLPLSELYEYVSAIGYEGSERTLRRKTKDLRNALKGKEVYFQREVRPAEIMEGDFTEFHITIGGVKRKVYLWVTSLPFSNAYFVTPFYHCSFEAFAEGSVDSFREFQGIAKKYRLDNMSPAVTKILSGKDRIVTARFAQFQQHYGFEQDFCNPGRGNEKGNVEANNKYIKKKIYARISLNNLSFTNIEAFKEFVWELCRDHNKKQSVSSKFKTEMLISLPKTEFSCFRTAVVSINKYSLFTLEKTGHMYSVPSRYIGLSIETRIYTGHIETIYNGKIVCSHSRIYGPRGLVSINPEHVIDGLLKKTGAMKDWKYRDVLFERPAWKSFYEKMIAGGSSDKDYLKCLKLMSKHGKELITVAMELAIESSAELSANQLSRLITNDMENIYDIKPLELDLKKYDEFLTGEENGSKLKGQS
ncbi:MAG: IS21 family transposase [Bacteriovoracaceae bacterium]|nr:IS21 family transposase [Bacteriovoracaceae bacterium]